MSTIAEQIARIPFWYHRIELPDGTVTPGCMPFCPEAYKLPESFAGKRVLDVGSWDGYFTWEAIKRGASEVIAIDDFSDVVNFVPGFNAWESWDICREAFGCRNCDRINVSLYDVTPERFGRFDYVLFYGVLYHCRYPMLAMDRLSAVCKGEIRVETAICDDYSAYRGGLDKGYPAQDRHCLAEFYPRNEYGNNPTNWWAPNLNCLKGLMAAAGFSQIELWKYATQHEVSQCRGFAIGKKGVA